MKIEDFDKYFNHTTDTYEFFKDDFEKILQGITPAKKEITENGIKIIKTMQKYIEPYLNIYSAKQLGELLFMSPRSISGSMRKLITDGYVKKDKTSNGVSYSLTHEGQELQFDKE